VTSRKTKSADVNSGIVVIPRESAEDILERLDAQNAHQERYMSAVRRGEFSNAWVDEILRQHECPIYDSEVEVLVPSDDTLFIK
jgi:hypothetical protein